MKFREILSHLISQWALTSQFCYGSGLVVAERTCWEKCFVGSGKKKNNNKTRSQHRYLSFRYTQCVLLTFGGQMGKQSTPGLLMAYWEHSVSGYCQIPELLPRRRGTPCDNQDPYQFVLCPLCMCFGSWRYIWDDCKVAVTNCSLRCFTMTLRTGYTIPLK